ncbi:hypothetical protein SAMN04490357_7708 [Streptomyces misionensis]|uniref:Uncharacterized protein n=2 Tax=Streptomyces misionensis TaxID=67331 RepID=A0A1H5K4C2_9ACTN|nr:hypothetical protein [Streptomyces misionensis]SEE59683.1 hypothetical protein SAMN04490357_7708 [Streptomyces misionensis]
MRNETAEQNRYQRALSAQTSASRDPSTSGQAGFWEFNAKVLREHPPADGPEPACQGCGEPWPCGRAETAMQQVGVRA